MRWKKHFTKIADHLVSYHPKSSILQGYLLVKNNEELNSHSGVIFLRLAGV